MEENSSTSEIPKAEDPGEFKKPVLIGRIGKLPKKARSDPEKVTDEEKNEKPVEKAIESNSKSSLPPAVLLKEISTPIPYKEPKWSGLCPEGSEYGLEVLKSGMILEKIDLTTRAYYVIGRLANCDIAMHHPTVSRHHAVIQYKAFAEEGEPPAGWYIYDLGSTHGTFLNRERVKPSQYVRLRVGHQIKFGSSTRTYIVLGPDFDCEGESELSVTEIKKRALEMKSNRDRLIQQAKEEREKAAAEAERKREEQGIDWGMGEDAEEEPDLSENPYASTGNEELYLDDPKKTLRGYYEREGLELTYDCEERGVGQFICRVELPIDDARGKPVIAEVIHRGKKKEAVIACALEACRILDRAGLLRQSKHESRRRKQRDWSQDDYYDSDEDTFLDRTGAVERKRTQRMRTQRAPDKRQPLTYDGLLTQIQEIESKISAEEKCLERLRANVSKKADNDEDDLDSYMQTLKNQGASMSQKAEISSCKMRIQKLKIELTKTNKLADVARPAHLPPLIKKDDSKLKVTANSVVYGKRLRLKRDTEKPKVKEEKKKVEETGEFVEEMDSDDEQETSKPQNSTEKESRGENNSTAESSKDKNISNPNTDRLKPNDHRQEESKESEEASQSKKIYGPMRPPENYVIPENYFDQETDRDLPEIMEDE